jgi:YVTN family beta-propeller protein
MSAARPKNAAFTNDPNVAVLTDLGKNEVLVLDIAAKKILRRIAVGKAPYGVAFVPRKP